LNDWECGVIEMSGGIMMGSGGWWNECVFHGARYAISSHVWHLWRRRVVSGARYADWFRWFLVAGVEEVFPPGLCPHL
jgi:hypothetical protein